MGGNAFTSFPTGADLVGGWVEVGRTTLGSAASTIDVSSIPNKRYYQILVNYDDSVDSQLRFNGISTTTYADRSSTNGSVDGTLINADKMIMDQTAANTNARLVVGYIANLSTKEKLGQFWTVKQQTAGAGTAPNRTEAVGKHAQTTNPIDQMTVVRTTGTYPIGAELVVLGWDPADVHTDNFWEELASIDQTSEVSSISSGTITAKKYLWVQFYTDPSTGLQNRISFNSDTGNNYASRQSNNGGTDALATSQPRWETSQFTNDTPLFTNMFLINISAQEKLGIVNTMVQNNAGATNIPTRNELVGKWDNISSQITEITVTASTGTITGNLRVWGSN